MTSKPRLVITTPSIRPENLHLLEQDEEMLSAPDYFDVRWLVLMDEYSLKSPEPGKYTPRLPWQTVEGVYHPRPEPRHGEDLYNLIADGIASDEYWMGIADDSLPVPGIFKALREAIDEGADVVVFPMDIPSVVYCKSAPESIRPGHISGGQVFHRRGVQGDVRWKPGNAELDGVFIKELWEATQGKATWKFMQEPVLSHNQLR